MPVRARLDRITSLRRMAQSDSTPALGAGVQSSNLCTPTTTRVLGVWGRSHINSASRQGNSGCVSKRRQHSDLFRESHGLEGLLGQVRADDFCGPGFDSWCRLTLARRIWAPVRVRREFDTYLGSSTGRASVSKTDG
jgi:hypothetical protein